MFFPSIFNLRLFEFTFMVLADKGSDLGTGDTYGYVSVFLPEIGNAKKHRPKAVIMIHTGARNTFYCAVVHLCSKSPGTTWQNIPFLSVTVAASLKIQALNYVTNLSVLRYQV